MPFLAAYVVAMIIVLPTVGPVAAISNSKNAPFSEMTSYPGFQCVTYSDPYTNYEYCSFGQFSGSAQQMSTVTKYTLGIGVSVHSVLYYDTTASSAPGVMWSGTTNIELGQAFSLSGLVTATFNGHADASVAAGWDYTYTYCTNSNCFTNTYEYTNVLFDAVNAGGGGRYTCNNCASYYYIYNVGAGNAYAGGGTRTNAFAEPYCDSIACYYETGTSNFYSSSSYYDNIYSILIATF